MMALIIAALALSAIYSGGMYCYLGYLHFTGRSAVSNDQLERYTFHLGACFIVAAGFLGLLLK